MPIRRYSGRTRGKMSKRKTPWDPENRSLNLEAVKKDYRKRAMR